MSRDLTCNETMPALDDGDSISDVRRMVPSRIIGQRQQSFATSLNLIASRNVSSNSSTSTSMTVRDVVSNRIRNRGGNESVVTGLNSSIHQTPSTASTSSPYIAKNIGMSSTTNTNNLIQSIFHDPNRPLTNSQPTGKYVNISINNSNNMMSHQVAQPQQPSPTQHPLQQHLPQSQQPQYIVSTSTIPVQRISGPSSTSSYRQQAPPASNHLDISQAPQKIGISIAYDTSAINNNVALSQPIVLSSTDAYINNNGTSTGPTSVTIRSQPSGSSHNVTQGGYTSYIIPPVSSEAVSTSIVNINTSGAYTNVITQQRSTDSPGKSIYLSKQSNSSASPSPVVFMSSGSGGITASSHYLQQVHPPGRPISSYPPEMTVGSVVRAGGNNNNNFVVTPTKPLTSTISGNSNNTGNMITGGLSRGASPYAVVIPRSESVLRESPNGLSNHGSTTPNGSQPSNSHSSPRPSILRGSSIARRFVERDATPISSATNFAAMNFADNNAQNVTSISYYTNNATSSSASIDGIVNDPRVNDGPSNSQDDSPRKRQRKQQFDNSQLQDKLMMEVHADPRLDQINTDNAGLWKSGGPIQSSMSKSGYNSGIDFVGGGGGLSGREPRRRGRPRSVNRPAELLHHPTTSQSPRILMNTTVHNINASQPIVGSGVGGSVAAPMSKSAGYSALTNNAVGANPTVVAYGTAPPPSASAVVASDGLSNSVTAPRSFMVDVDDRMLQVPPGSKRPRKYKKRTPELDPETGEPVKKPRKKGSGRKSKKDLLLLEAAKREIDVYTSDAGGSNAPTVGELLTAKTSTGSASGGSHHNLTDLQQHIYIHQQPQPHHSHGRYGTTYVNLSASSGGEKIHPAASHHGQQPAAKQPPIDGAGEVPAPSTSTVTTAHTQILAEERRVIATLCQLLSKRNNDSATGMATAENGVAKVEPTDEEESVELAAACEPSFSHCLPNNFAKNLLDAAKYCELSGLWKSANRNLASSVADDYDEIHEFLTNLRAEKLSCTRQNTRWSMNDLREVCCPIFNSFEDFKTSLDLLKLLPTTCQYFKSSRTLLDSLRSNLYGFSAYQLAKLLIGSPTADAGGLTLSKADVKRTKTIASLRSAERKLQGKCENLFDFIYNELKRRLEAPMSQKDGVLNSAKSMLIDMSVVTLLDELTDTVDRLNSEESEQNTSRHQRGDRDSQASMTQLSNPLAVGCISPMSILSAIRQLPTPYRNLLSASSGATRRHGVRRRPRRHCESSSESENQLRDNRVRDDSDLEASDEKKVEYVYQKLHELGDRSQKAYRLARRQSLRLLERLEPSRHRATVVNAIRPPCKDGDTPDESVERLREDLETAFLMEIPSHKSCFKPLNIYNSSKSITMKPSSDVVKTLFNNLGVSCYSSDVNDENVPRVKSPSVEHLKDVENNFLVLEEIKEMEDCSQHISAVAAERLQQKYNNKHSMPDRNDMYSDCISKNRKRLGVDTEGMLPSFADFHRSLKRPFPRNESEEVKQQYFNDRCKEVHEMAAVFVGLSHSRANILRQCYDSLVDVLKTKMTGRQQNKVVVASTVTSQDSDMEVDGAAKSVSNQQSSVNGGGNTAAANNSVYDYDVDSPVGSHVSDNNDSDHSSDDDESENINRLKNRLNARRGNNFVVSANNGGNASAAKKRRWSGYRRQTPVSQAPGVSGAAQSRVTLAK